MSRRTAPGRAGASESPDPPPLRVGPDAAEPVFKPELARAPGEALWVFGYGSLMWNPEFPYAERHPALLRGYHRSFCVYSHRYRGTPERPGLVLGLDRGGACRGIVFRVAPADEDTVLDYLWRREMVTGVYRPKLLPVTTPAGRVRACTFVVDRRHRQYCGGLCEDETVRLIRQGRGQRGPNEEYLANTVAHLDELGIPDGPLHRLLGALRRHGA